MVFPYLLLVETIRMHNKKGMNLSFILDIPEELTDETYIAKEIKTSTFKIHFVTLPLYNTIYRKINE